MSKFFVKQVVTKSKQFFISNFSINQIVFKFNTHYCNCYYINIALSVELSRLSDLDILTLSMQDFKYGKWFRNHILKLNKLQYIKVNKKVSIIFSAFPVVTGIRKSFFFSNKYLITKKLFLKYCSRIIKMVNYE